MLRVLPLAFLIATAAHAAPGPKAADPTWLPIKEGDTRVYEVRDGDRVLATYTDVVTKVEKKDADFHVTIRRESPAADPFVTTIAVTGGGLLRVELNGRKLEKPSLLLKTPPKVGAKWEVGSARYEVTQEEDVEVPAGKFRAVRVKLTDGAESTLWFAPNVGVVKMASTQGPVVQVLKEFKPAK
jgi:hypothetical protein